MVWKLAIVLLVVMLLLGLAIERDPASVGSMAKTDRTYLGMDRLGAPPVFETSAELLEQTSALVGSASDGSPSVVAFLAGSVFGALDPDATIDGIGATTPVLNIPYLSGDSCRTIEPSASDTVAGLTVALAATDDLLSLGRNLFVTFRDHRYPVLRAESFADVGLTILIFQVADREIDPCGTVAYVPPTPITNLAPADQYVLGRFSERPGRGSGYRSVALSVSGAVEDPAGVASGVAAAPAGGEAHVVGVVTTNELGAVLVPPMEFMPLVTTAVDTLTDEFAAISVFGARLVEPAISAKWEGCRVVEVELGSRAERSGVLAGDVIVTVGATRPRFSGECIATLRRARTGDGLEISRDGQRVHTEVEGR